MQSTFLPIDPTVLSIGESGTERAKGVHASDIYGSFFRHYDPKKYGKYSSGKPDPLLVEPGLVFETMLEEGLRRRLVEQGSSENIERPGEFTWSGVWNDKPITIHYNPDLFIFNGCFRIGEIKSTWKWSSVSHEQIAAAQDGDQEAIVAVEAVPLEPKFEKWTAQIMMYCKFLNTPYARLYAWFINANGRPPVPSQLLSWDLTFTQDELDFNLSLLLNHADEYGLFDAHKEAA